MASGEGENKLSKTADGQQYKEQNETKFVAKIEAQIQSNQVEVSENKILNEREMGRENKALINHQEKGR